MSIFLLWEMILTQYNNNLWAGFNSLGYILEGKYSCLKNPMDRGAWQATVQRVPESRT